MYKYQIAYIKNKSGEKILTLRNFSSKSHLFHHQGTSPSPLGHLKLMSVELYQDSSNRMEKVWIKYGSQEREKDSFRA